MHLLAHLMLLQIKASVAGDLTDLSLQSGGYEEAGYKIATNTSHISTYNIADNQGASFIHAALVLKQAGGGITPTITIATVTANSTENSGTALKYQFTRTGSTDAILNINFGVSGTAATADFTIPEDGDGNATNNTGNVSYNSVAKTGTITFPIGASTVDLEVVPVGDSIIEGDETVVVTILADTL